MTMQRGNFILSCDEDDCDAEVDLETTNFEEAKENKWVYQQAGWTYRYNGRTSKDYCPDHDPDD